MYPYRHVFLLAAICCLFMTSCSVEKRIYRPGYHVTWNHPNPEQRIAGTPEKAADTPETTVSASVEESGPTIIEKQIVTIGAPVPDSCGDMISLRDGSTVKAKVIEVGSTEIKYKRCDNPDGPIYTISKNEVASVEYHNGTKESFVQKTESVKQDNSSSYYTPKDNSFAEKNAAISKKFGILSLVALALAIVFISAGIFLISNGTYIFFFLFLIGLLALIAELVFAIVALVGSLIAKKKDTSGDPEIKKQWKAGQIMACIGIGVIALFILGYITIALGAFY